MDKVNEDRESERERKSTFLSKGTNPWFPRRSFVYNILCTILNVTSCHLHIQQRATETLLWERFWFWFRDGVGLCQHTGIRVFFSTFTMKHFMVNNIVLQGIQCWKIKSRCCCFTFTFYLTISLCLAKKQRFYPTVFFYFTPLTISAEMKQENISFYLHRLIFVCV